MNPLIFIKYRKVAQETKKQSHMNSKWNNITMKYCSIMG